MRNFFEPTASPAWLRQVLNSIRAALGDIWPAPLRLKDYAAADLPAAADFSGGLVFNATDLRPAWSDGAAWFETMPYTAGAALTRANDTNVTLTLSGSPSNALLAATSLTLGWAGQLGVGRGGTNIASYAVGDLLYASAAMTLSKLAAVATGNVLISGGAGTAPTWGKAGISTHVSGLASGVATFLGTPSSANLAAAITDETGTGALVFAGSPTFTGTAIFAAISPSGIVTLSGSNSFGAALTNTGIVYHDATLGLVAAGAGSTYDLVLANKAGAFVMSVATGTTTAAFGGNISAVNGAFTGTLVAKGGVPTSTFTFVHGDGSADVRAQFYNSNAYAVALTRGAGNGNVYLGATGAAAPNLIVSNNAGSTLATFSNSGAFSTTAGITVNSGGLTADSLFALSDFRNAISLYTAGSVVYASLSGHQFTSGTGAQWALLTSTGLGLGEDAPAAKLDVQQDADSNTNGIRIARANEADAMFLYMSAGGFSGLNDSLNFHSSFAGAVVAAIDRAGHAAFSGFVRTGSYTVAGLPAAATAGAGGRAFVTDANATTFASVVAGGGSNKVPVYSDGTSWRIG